MSYYVKSITPFIGAKNFDTSRNFYNDFGFGFYLQDYYVKDWVDNSMLFLEVENSENT